MNLGVLVLTLPEVVLGLGLQLTVRIHQVIIEFDKLLHFLQSISCHLSLVCCIVLLYTALFRGVLVASCKGLVLSREEHDPLFILHLGLQLCLIEGIDLLPLHIEIDTDKIGKCLH